MAVEMERVDQPSREFTSLLTLFSVFILCISF